MKSKLSTLIIILIVLLVPISMQATFYVQERLTQKAEAQYLGDLLSAELKRLEALAIKEGSAERAEADAKEWSYLEPEALQNIIDTSKYYQEHPAGKAYLEYLLKEQQEEQQLEKGIITKKSLQKRPIFLVIPLNSQEALCLEPLIHPFEKIIYKQTMSSEFLDLSEDEIRNILPSILLTIFHNWGWKIHTITDNYVILIKYIEKELIK